MHDVCSQFSSGSGVEIEDENVGNHKTCFEFEVRIVLQAILFLCKVVCCVVNDFLLQKKISRMIIIDHYQA